MSKEGLCVKGDILLSQIDSFTFLSLRPPPKKNHIFYHLISPCQWVLCQIWGDRQGQIRPHSPQLALTPVTRVSERGRRFHAGYTICPVFTLLSICITDSRPEWHQHEATVIECYFFFFCEGGAENCHLDSAQFTPDLQCVHGSSLCTQGVFVL